MPWAPYEALKTAAILNGIASRIASGIVGHPVGVSVVSLADIEALPLGRYEQWRGHFLPNFLQRRQVTNRARGE